MAFRRPESALVVIYDQAGRVLMLQRQDDPDFWQSVTGTLEAEEAPRQTAIREVREETGISIEAPTYEIVDCRHVNQYEIRQMWRHRYPPHSRVNTEHVFVLQVLGTEPIVLTEHLAYEWLPKKEAILRAWSTTNQLAISQFVPDIEGH